MGGGQHTLNRKQYCINIEICHFDEFAIFPPPLVMGAFWPDGLAFTRLCKIFPSKSLQRIKELKDEEFTIT